MGSYHVILLIDEAFTEWYNMIHGDGRSSLTMHFFYSAKHPTLEVYEKS